MFKIRSYRIGFDPWGLGLFLVVMIPNFIWFAVPATDDILRNPSATPFIDTAASVSQAVMVAALCVIINKRRQRPMPKALFFGIVLLTALYYAGWCFYYAGLTNAAVILDLCIAPCSAFIAFSLSRKNMAALIPAGIFTVCHVLSSVMNFIA